MKPGFLGGATAAAHQSKSAASKKGTAAAGSGPITSTTPALGAPRPLHEPQQTPPSPPPQQQQQQGEVVTTGSAQSSTEQHAASWRQCMELLASASNEKKFVGLLLVTKLLPQGGDDAIRQVLTAIGWPFLQRLLLPLRQPPPAAAVAAAAAAPVDEDKLQQQQLSASLGISIISAACRLPEVAASEELLQLLPLLLKVAAAGGVAPVLQQQQQQQPGLADAAGDAAAAADALECLIAAASCGSYQQTVLRESCGFAAATRALLKAVQAASAAGPASAVQGYPDTAASSADEAAAAAQVAALRAVMLSVRLMGLLLDGAGGSRAELIQQEPSEAAAAVMLLSHVFGGTLAPPTAAGGSTKQQQQQQHGPRSAVGPIDPAALQLDAQHTLLLLLPLPAAAAEAAAILQAAGSGGAAALSAAAGQQGAQGNGAGVAQALVSAAAAAVGDWPAAVRAGLEQLLRGRVGAVQRHSALQLAAAVLELLGPAWLLPQQQWQQQQQRSQHTMHGSGASTQSGYKVAGAAAAKPEAFLRVLMEVLAIETPLLLSDAVNPGAAVPKARLSMAARTAAGGASGGAGAGAVVNGGLAGCGADGSGGPGGDVEATSSASSDVDMADADAGAAGKADASMRSLNVREVVQQQQQQQRRQQQQQKQRQQQWQRQRQEGDAPAAAGPGTSSTGGSSSSVGKDWAGPPGSEGQQHQLQQQQQRPLKSLRQQLEEVQLKEDDVPPGPDQQGAGERALQCLPSCLALLEGCLEVIANQAACLEELADIDSTLLEQRVLKQQAAAAAGAAAAGTGSSRQGSAGMELDLGSKGARQVSWQDLLPVLSPAQVEQLLERMGQVTQVLCEFLDYATSAHQPTAATAASTAAATAVAPVNVWIILGAARLLGRFLADAPELHAAEVRKLLPKLLTMQHTTSAQAAGQGSSAARKQQQVEAVLPVPLVGFMLPAMLCWTSKHSPQHQQWVDFMVDPGSGCVHALATLAGQLAGTAAAAAAETGKATAPVSRSGSGGGAVRDPASANLQASEAQLGTACQVLQQLLSSLPAVLSHKGSTRRQHTQPCSGGSSGRLGLQPAQVADLAAALECICNWAAARQQQQQAQVLLHTAPPASSAGSAAAAEAVAQLASLQSSGPGLAVLLPAAALAGQLLECTQVPPLIAASAAQLLCWGCYMGWCYQTSQQAHAGSRGSVMAAVGEGLGPLLLELREEWEVAELKALWDACLVAAAELVTQAGPSSSIGLLLAAAGSNGGWLAHARRQQQEQVEDADDGVVGLQLLLQAVGAL